MKPEITNEMKEAWASLVKSNDREAMAEIITEFVQPNHITNTYMSLLMNTRALQPGDSLRKVMRKGIEVRTLVPGAVHLASEVTTSERMNFILDGIEYLCRRKILLYA